MKIKVHYPRNQRLELAIGNGDVYVVFTRQFPVLVGEHGDEIGRGDVWGVPR